MTIKLLSNSTINKISAGEVIERPASVVKELVENAIDAGSKKISITLECAGKNLILISDDGVGMEKNELDLAIQRHATSKLDEDDLLNISSFGFRGEALPSIGAISKFKITSKKRGSEENYAHCLTITGGVVEKAIPATGAEGTTIEIRDLFFATPARLKFLRSDRTELNASIQVVKKLALAHPEIGFCLTHNNKDILNIKKREGDIDSNLKHRITEILGDDFIENASKVAHSRDGMEVYGYTSLPTYNRASSEDQFLFINERPVKDKILNIALRVAYQDYLARDRHPVSVLFLNINPQLVDVNVHPAKTEVRFNDPSLIRSMVISAIKDALNSSSDRVSTSASSDAIDYIMQSTKERESKIHHNDQAPVITSTNFAENDVRPQGNFQMQNSSSLRSDRGYSPRVDYTIGSFVTDKLMETAPSSQNLEETIAIEEENAKKFKLGAAKAQLYKNYIISQTEDSMIITDQHAAHERIGYEQLKLQIEKNGLMKQRLLIPEIVELPDANRAQLLNENKETLSNLGLTIEKFGEKSIIVSELPSLVGDINPSKLVNDLSDHLLSMGQNIALTELIEHVTETYACHYAIRSGRKLNSHEMNELLRQMENTPFSGQCNHGRQTYIELKLKDIEKLFGRR